MIPEVNDEKILLQRIALGDSEAFSVIFNRYKNKVLSFCTHILQSNILAEEVLQEVMLKLWLLGYKIEDIDHLDGWLRRVARNRSIDLLRQQKNAQLHYLENKNNIDHLSNFTEETVLLRDARRLVEEGIAALPAQQKKVYEMIEKEAHTVEEVSELLGLQVSTVNTHLKLARKSLRNFLSKHIDLIVLLIFFKLF
jgi:RNA polymerase sigma-70 factor (ECF subfamily)